MFHRTRLPILALTLLALVLSACSGAEQTQTVFTSNPLLDEAITAVETTIDDGSTTAETVSTDATLGQDPAAQSSPTLQADSSLQAQEDAFVALYKQTNPGVVAIFVGDGQGSGFVIDTNGHIVTNNHVVVGGGTITVQFHDGTTRDAELIGTDPDSDLAVIKVDPTTVELSPLPLADSDVLEVGEVVLAIGSPFGLANTLTTGIISGLNRLFPGAQSPDGSYYNIPDIIQTDAAINPGNSGGPLLNLEGEVIGVNTAIESPVRGSSGVGFAVPSNVVSAVVPDLISFGSVQNAWIGISGGELNSALAQELGLDVNQRGIVISEVIAGGPAAQAGLQGMAIDGTTVGDIIVGINGQEVVTFSDLLGYIVTDAGVGDTVTLSVLRNGQIVDVAVVLAARPS